MDLNDLDFANATLGLDAEPEAQLEVTETVASESTESTSQEPVAEADTTPTKDTPAQEQPVVESEPSESDEERFARLFKSKYGYDSIEEYEAAKRAEYEASLQPTYASEEVRKLNEWVSKGLKPEDYYRTQTHNFDEMPEVELVQNLYALENPDLTPDEIALLVEDDFKLNADEYDEEDIAVKRARIRLRQRASEARQKLKEWQVQAATPQEDAQAQAQQAQLQEWQRTVDQFIPGISAIDIPLDGKGDKFSFAVDNKAELEGYMKNLNSFFEGYVSQDAKGNPHYNLQGLAEDMYIAKNWRKVAQAIAAQSKGKGIEQVKQELNNSSVPEKPTASPQENSLEDRLGKFIFR